MADDVTVKFGASIEGLTAGVNAAKEQIEGLTSPVTSFVSSLSGVAEAVGVAFAVEKIKAFAETMADLGEKTLNSAFILGQSVEEYAKLSGALQLAGGDADSAQHTIERLGKSVQSALKDPTGQAATSFHNLGVSQREVQANSTNLIGLLGLVIEKFGELKPSLQNVGELYGVVGRGADNLAGLLRGGVEEFDNNLKASQGYANALVANAAAMDKTAAKQHQLSLDLKTLGVDAFGVIAKAVDFFISALDRLVQTLDYVINKLAAFVKAANQANYDLQNFIYTTIHGENTALLPPVEVKAPKTGSRDLGTTKPGGSKGGGEAKSRLAEWRDELQQKLMAEENYFNSSKSEELTFWEAKRALTESGSKEQFQVDNQIYTLRKELAKKTEADLIEEQTYKQKVSDQYFASEKSRIEAEVSLGKLTAQQGIVAERDLLDQKWDLDQAYFDKKLAAAAKDLDESKKLQEQEYLAERKYYEDLQGLDIKAAEASKATWEGIVAPVESAVSTSVSGIIQGTTTAQQAMARLADSILQSFVNSAVKGALDKLAAVVSGSLVGGTGQDFSGGINGAGELVEGAGASLGIGSIFKGLASFLPIFDKGGIVPSAQGGWSLPSLGSGGVLAQLHSNEMVLPADISQGLQGMIAGGGPGGVSVNISAIDSQDVRRFFTNNGALLVTALNKAMRNGSFARVG